MVSELIAGRYELLERLGKGGMGEVWRARDTTLRRHVAVKLIGLSTDDPTIQARFEREAVTMAGIAQPNVATTFDAGVDEERAYLVMELLTGGDLESHLRSRGPFSFDEIRTIGAGVASGLAAAHASGVIHRDIKPANIMLEGETPKILDFGIARLVESQGESLTATSTTIGTAAYLSPEQSMGAALTPATDAYSLGCLIFALATGHPPFTAENQVALLRAHAMDAPPRLAYQRMDCPEDIDQLVGRLLAKEPSARPDLTSVAHVLAHRTQPPTSPPLTIPWTAPSPPTQWAPAGLPRWQSTQIIQTSTPLLAHPRASRTPGRSWLSWLPLMMALVVFTVVGVAIFNSERNQSTAKRPLAHPQAQSTDPMSTDAPNPSDESGQPSKPAASTTAPQAKRTGASSDPVHATRADLNRVAVPKYCQYPAGSRLSNGKITVDLDGRRASAELRGSPLFVDLDGDGQKEALSYFNCNAGGVGWPDALIAVKPGGRLLSALHLSEVYNAQSSKIYGQDLEVDEGVIFMTVHVGLATERTRVTYQAGQLKGHYSDPFKGAVLTLDGFGPLKLGMTLDDLVNRGWAVMEGPCGVSRTQRVIDLGLNLRISDNKLRGIRTLSSEVQTRSGAKVGMGLDAVAAIYGDDWKQLTEGSLASPDTYVVEHSGRSMIFFFDAGVLYELQVHDEPAADIIATGSC